jgi:sugar lactone lactonase YvrE
MRARTARWTAYSTLLFVVTVLAQAPAQSQNVINTIAGGGPNNVPAFQASVPGPKGVLVDGAGNFYYAAGNRVFKVDKSGQLHIVAGTGVPANSGDNGPATNASIGGGSWMAFDASGNLFVDGSGSVRRIDAKTGIITTYAGGGPCCGLGDGGPANAVSFDAEGLALDANGNLFIADTDNARIRRVDAATGIITTYAGNGLQGNSGDGGQATAATLYNPRGLALDAKGNLFISESPDYLTGDARVRRVDAATGIITTYAGGQIGYSGDGGPATAASLSEPMGLAVDPNGNLYIADEPRIRRVDAQTQIITTVAGNGFFGFSGDGGPALQASLDLPIGVAVDSTGSLFIADYNTRIRRVDAQTQIITTVAGNGQYSFSGDGGPALQAALQAPGGVAQDSSGNIFIADTGNSRIRGVDASSGAITTVAGTGVVNHNYPDYSGDGVPAVDAPLDLPNAVAVDSGRNILFADTLNNRIRRVDAVTGIISTVAGADRSTCTSVAPVPATLSCLTYPGGVAVATNGDVFILDSGDNRVVRIDHVSGYLITVVGGPGPGYCGDGGPAIAACLKIFPVFFGAETPPAAGLAVDANGNVFISDVGNNRIRRVDAVTQIITTVAGNGQNGFSGDGGPATAATLNFPAGIAVDPKGDFFFADGGTRIRRVDATTGMISTGSISTFAGTGRIDFTGDGGPAASASLAAPIGVAWAGDGSNTLFITESAGSNRVRVVSVVQ